MPLKWTPGVNPFVHTYFRKLRVGAIATFRQIDDSAKDLKRNLAGGATVELDGVRLDEHDIAEAATALQKKESLAEELLLVHPQTGGENKKIKELVKKLQAATALGDERPAVPLRHPLAVFAYVPAPEPAAVEWPAWGEFGLPGPGHPDDRALDIVFDC
ncbi:MAG TPA: hypothetical protein VD866_21010 [Urbifossiella sp.]|nr:hypothetical protein [Urbifossiella sp.]